MSVVNILEVSPPHRSRAALGTINLPQSGAKVGLYAVEIRGWVVGRSEPVVRVEVVQDGSTLRSAMVSQPRPDVAEQYPDLPAAETSGFTVMVGVIGLPDRFTLTVQAVLGDGARVTVGSVTAERKPLGPQFPASLQPLMVTSLGRTGTTWLMRVLAEHPAITTNEIYPYETRAGSYWLHMLKVLSEPANYAESTHPDRFTQDLTQIGHHPAYHPVWFSSTIQELGERYPTRLAALAQESIEGFYREVAASQDDEPGAYFAEKYPPNHVPWIAWELYPRAREIFLVRDFRDMVASVLAFNAKRGEPGFGRQFAADDVELVHQLGAAATRLVRDWDARQERACLVRYEDFVTEPGESLRTILHYLELDASEDSINGMLERAAEDNDLLVRHRTSSAPSSSIGRWRSDLDPALQAACNDAFVSALEAFGYNTA